MKNVIFLSSGGHGTGRVDRHRNPSTGGTREGGGGGRGSNSSGGHLGWSTTGTQGKEVRLTYYGP